MKIFALFLNYGGIIIIQILPLHVNCRAKEGNTELLFQLFAFLFAFSPPFIPLNI